MDKALRDPNILSLLQRIAEMSARCESLWDRLANAQAIVDLREVQKLWKELWSANAKLTAAKDQATKDRWLVVVNERQKQIDQLLNAGADEQFAWDEFHKATESTRRLIESERRREIELQQMLTANQVATLFDMMAQAVRRNVSNPSELRSISADFVRLTGLSLGATSNSVSLTGSANATVKD